MAFIFFSDSRHPVPRYIHRRARSVTPHALYAESPLLPTARSCHARGIIIGECRAPANANCEVSLSFASMRLDGLRDELLILLHWTEGPLTFAGTAWLVALTFTECSCRSCKEQGYLGFRQADTYEDPPKMHSCLSILISPL